mmetsp:Transcript_15743/g.40750  ORF Transcript_15743/g.40750 Transcript_15743/m.40750 type:complete len:227 (+) Transcript_15743:620-1300(+)
MSDVQWRQLRVAHHLECLLPGGELDVLCRRPRPELVHHAAALRLSVARGGLQVGGVECRAYGALHRLVPQQVDVAPGAVAPVFVVRARVLHLTVLVRFMRAVSEPGLHSLRLHRVASLAPNRPPLPHSLRPAGLRVGHGVGPVARGDGQRDRAFHVRLRQEPCKERLGQLRRRRLPARPHRPLTHRLVHFHHRGGVDKIFKVSCAALEHGRVGCLARGGWYTRTWC